MSSRLLSEYAERAERELRVNILPFWLRHGLDRERGGVVSGLDLHNRPQRGVERGCLLSARTLWTFSAAHRHHPDAALEEAATWARQDLVRHFWDETHGGLFWSVDGENRPARTRKQVYGIAFGIYGFAEHHRATGNKDSLDRAVALFRLLERHAWDPVDGGYFEAFSREWQPLDDWRLSDRDQNDPKSQNTHLHVMEAYANLLRVWPDLTLRDALRRTVDVMLERILDPRSHHLGLFFDERWQLRSRAISYGHDIEAAWLLHDAADSLGDEDLLVRVRREAIEIARATLLEGVDADGAILYEGLPDGTITNSDKDWWPQIEGVVGFLDAYEIGGEEAHLRAALRLWDFIEAHVVDRSGGEWHRTRTRELALVPAPKIGFWKCPYHNGRGCMEVAARLRRIARRKDSGSSADQGATG